MNFFFGFLSGVYLSIGIACMFIMNMKHNVMFLGNVFNLLLWPIAPFCDFRRK